MLVGWLAGLFLSSFGFVIDGQFPPLFREVHRCVDVHYKSPLLSNVSFKDVLKQQYDSDFDNSAELFVDSDFEGVWKGDVCAGLHGNAATRTNVLQRDLDVGEIVRLGLTAGANIQSEMCQNFFGGALPTVLTVKRNHGLPAVVHANINIGDGQIGSHLGATHNLRVSERLLRDFVRLPRLFNGSLRNAEGVLRVRGRFRGIFQGVIQKYETNNSQEEANGGYPRHRVSGFSHTLLGGEITFLNAVKFAAGVAIVFLGYFIGIWGAGRSIDCSRTTTSQCLGGVALFLGTSVAILGACFALFADDTWLLVGRALLG